MGYVMLVAAVAAYTGSLTVRYLKRELRAPLVRSLGEGAFREVDPLLAARAFIGMVVHHRLLHEIFGVPMHRSHDETVATYVDLFLAGLMKSPARRRDS